MVDAKQILKNIEANVKAYDLFPKFFKLDGLECQYADLSKTLPIQSNYSDFILCQEGIEHLSDQVLLLKECNRILKMKGILLLTTPNDSKLRSKLSYFLSESEYFYKRMPHNELDSIWFSDKNKCRDIYYGHIFPIGIQKLRTIAKISGFKIKKIHHSRVNHTSFILLLFFYPLILLVNLLGYFRAMKKNFHKEIKNKVYNELLRLGLDPRILIDGHLIVEFEKENELDAIKALYYGTKHFDNEENKRGIK